MYKILLLSLVLFLIACAPKYVPLVFGDKQKEIDNKLIIEHLKENKLKAEHTESGIYYIIEEAGSDEHPAKNSRVKAHYKGTLLNGTKFDSSYDRGKPLDFGLGQVIKGWQEAIPMLGKGGKGKFFIPSNLAYGSKVVGADIPANSVLVFDVELVDFE